MAKVLFTVVSFLWHFAFEQQIYLFDGQVIWAIGCSMIFLSLLLFLPDILILIISCTIILGHNLFDNYNPHLIIWDFLHLREQIPLSDNIAIESTYPLIPWLGLIGLGYIMGKHIWRSDIAKEKRNQRLFYFSIGAFILGCTLRFFNIYGDPCLWHVQDTLTHSFMDFINVRKYPPSLIYLLMTMSIAWFILWASSQWKNIEQSKLATIIISYGKAPIAYYVAHLAVIGLLNRLFGYLTEGAWHKYQTDKLWLVWVIALVTASLLYPVVTWFFKFRAAHITQFPFLRYL